MANKKTRARAPSKRSPSGARRAAPRAAQRPSAPVSIGVTPSMLVSGGIALAALVLLVTAGIGAAVLVGGLLSASAFVAVQIRAAAAGDTALRTAEKAIVFALVFLLPVAIDPRTADVFASVKFTVLVTGAALLFGLFAVDRVSNRRPLRATPAHVAVAFLVVWGTISTLASGRVTLSALGFYSSNNGLFAYVAVAGLFVVVADAVRPRDVAPLARVLWFATTGVVVLYGVLQLLERAWPGRGFDPVNWPAGVGEQTFGTSGVWSTLGNPNHLGGFCAMVLPVGVSLLVRTSSRIERAVGGAIFAGAAVIVGQTASRGAWLATVVGLTLVALVERREIAAFIGRSKAIVVAAAAVVAGAAALSLNSGLLSRGASGLLETGGNGTISQRFEFWRATVRMAGRAPVLGHGFDTFRLTWPNFLTARFANTWDPQLQATDPHNIFFTHLYWGGWPAALALAVVTVLVGAAVRRLARAGAGTREPDVRLAAAFGAAALAFLTVELFDRERLELSAVFWVAVAVAVTAHARLRRDDVPAAEQPRRIAAPPGRRGRERRAAIAVATAVAVVAAEGAALFYGSAPWRADAALGQYRRNNRAAIAAQRTDPALGAAFVERAVGAVRDAESTNRWELEYARTRADQLRATAAVRIQNRRPANEIVPSIAQAVDLYRRALSYAPHYGDVVAPLAQSLLQWATVDPTGRDRATDALRLLRRESAYAPYNVQLRMLYAQALVTLGRSAEGARVMDDGIARTPRNGTLLTAAVTIYRLAGQRDKADRAARVLTTIGWGVPPEPATATASG